MNEKLFNAIMFATGAAIGSLVTWKIVKTRYDQLIQREVDAFKEDYVRCMRGRSENDSQNADISDNEDYDDEDYDDEEEDESDMYDYCDLVNEYAQSGDEAENDEEGVGDAEVPYINGPYVITPEDFGDGNFDHALHCVTYYRDGILADDWLVQLDIDETIGEDSLSHFGDSVDDVIHVRNERLGADYEVVRDPRTYAEAEAASNASLLHAYADRGSY